MLIAELTVNNSNLNNILRALVINEGPKAINVPCKDIVIRDIRVSKPDILVNCYTLDELEGSIKYLTSQGYEISKAKEIIPNDYSLGLVRDLPLTVDNMQNLGVSPRFRYYFMLESSNDSDKTFCLTYNPECSRQQAVCVKLETGVIKCSTLQVVFDKLKNRKVSPIKKVHTEHGEMQYYNIEGENL